MAILIVEHNDTVEGASLIGRVLIGRRSSNHIVLDHDDVSRIHAWIDTADQAFCITDAGSRTGTFVNGHRVVSKVALHDGDRIDIGPARLIFRSGSSLPAGVAQLNFGERAEQADGGILFDCTCGAPLWISSAYAGRLGKCKFCGAVVQVPKRQGVGATPPQPIAAADASGARSARSTTPAASSASAASTLAPQESDAEPLPSCGACQSSIEQREALTVCPACGLSFHADCWAENFGCSAYGCSQVNILLPKSEVALDDPATESDAAGNGAAVLGEAEGSASKIPAGHALLATSVFGTLLGILAFGVPALLSLIACLIYLKRHGRSNKVVLAAAGLSLAGIASGVAVSYIWWMGRVG